MFYDPQYHQKTETVEPWRQALLGAADLIERRGHCKGRLQDNDGRLCLFGALSVAVEGKIRVFGPVVMAAFQRVQEHLGRCPVSYNNATERTAAEVIATLRACAATE